MACVKLTTYQLLNILMSFGPTQRCFTLVTILHPVNSLTRECDSVTSTLTSVFVVAVEVKDALDEMLEEDRGSPGEE